jgi:molybdopterin synthase catalytic subunit
MSIQIKFFASLAETLNRREATVPFEPGMTVEAVWRLFNDAEDMPRGVLSAVNMEYCELDQPLADNDEVAFFPPVTGGETVIAARIIDGPLEPWSEIRAFERDHPQFEGKFGATAVFIGTMRDFNDDSDVSVMTLEHYPGMTERHLEEIAQAASGQWPLLAALVTHRVGALNPGDPIVVVCVWSAHRAEAFDACRFIMEDLKSKAPFWKKETRPDGERWVEKNTSGFTG